MYLAVCLLLTIGIGWFNLQRLGEGPESWLVKGLLTGGFAGALGVLLGAPDLFGIIWLWAWGLFGVTARPAQRERFEPSFQRARFARGRQSRNHGVGRQPTANRVGSGHRPF